MRRGVFGGSFDPVHYGHLTVAAAAADRLSLDRVHFVPAGQQPFKRGLHRAPAADRVAMLELAAAEDERFIVDRREVERDGPSYTVETLRALAAEFAGDPLVFLLGADAARDLPAWQDAAQIPGLATVVVLSRPGVAPPEFSLAHRALQVPAVDVSATGVRARAARGESIAGLVPLPVAEYIERHGLYR